jgi:8-oxo-dGTP diphosphatase
MFLADASVLTQGKTTLDPAMSSTPGILARGPWDAARVAARWREDAFAADAGQEAAADAAIAALADRGSPAHDGLAARLAGYRDADGRLELELQPMRWSLRLLPAGAADALSVLCVVRDAAGRWLAGRRAGWVATWAGRWALGAGGTVEVGENPVHALSRELEEEWAVRPERLEVEALVRLPSGMVMLIGQAWLGADPEVTRDAEHDEHAWWPADPVDWPDEATGELRLMAGLLA